MTVVLVVMCFVVGALELYAGRQSRRQTADFASHMDELRRQIDRQNEALAAADRRIEAELTQVRADVPSELAERLRDNTERIDRLAALLSQADDYIRAQAARLHDLEQQRITLTALRRKLGDIEASMRPLVGPVGPVGDGGGEDGRVDTALHRIAELERHGDDIIGLQRDLTKALESVEDSVTDLLGLTERELTELVSTTLAGSSAGPPAGALAATGGDGRLSALIVGRLWCRDEALREPLTRLYEQCLAAHRLHVRFRTAADDPARTRYFLAGHAPHELAAGFATKLIAIAVEPPPPGRADHDEAALHSLLRTSYESTGAIVQIGPLVLVRTRQELLGGVLTNAQLNEFEDGGPSWDPLDTAVRLRMLPRHQVWDLTGWAAAPPPEPSRPPAR